MVGGSPARNTWNIHCSGALFLPYSYGCSPNYGLDRVGGTRDDYIDATAHIDGGSDIHFKIYRIYSRDKDNNKPLDWVGLFTSLFGDLLGDRVTITIPRDTDGTDSRHISTGVFFAGTNCPDFSFAAGHISKDPNNPGRYG